MKSLFSMALLICLTGNINAQISIKSEKFGRQKELLTLIVDPNDTADLKINVFPENSNWKLQRNFNDPKIIEINFIPTTDGTYFFVVSGNKENKTLVEKSTITIGNFVPPKPDPVPVIPTDNPYLDPIKAAYLVNPDNDSRVKLISVYKELINSSYTSWETCQADLRKKIKNSSLEDKLQKVKDTVADLLTKDSKSVPYSNELKDKLLKQVVDALNTL